MRSINLTPRDIAALAIFPLFFTCVPAFDSLMDGVTTSKQLYFYASCSVVLLVVAIILLFRRNPIELVFNRLDVAIVALWLWAMIRAAFTDYISWNDDGIITLGLLLFVYFIVKNIVASEQRKGGTRVFSILAIGFMSGGLIQAVYGVLQLYGLDPSPTNNYFKLVGSFGNPDALAGYLSTVIPFALGMYLLTPKEEDGLRFVRQIGMITFFAGLFILPATMIRGAWLGVAVGSLVVLSVKFDLLKKTKAIFSRTFSRVLIAMGLIVCTVAIGYGLYNLKPDSANGRFLIWKTTAGMIKDHPLWGIGFDRFAVEFGNYQAAYFARADATENEEYLAGNVHQAHNEILQVFSELGIIGLGIFSLIISVSVFRSTKSVSNPIAKCAQAAILSFTVFSFFSFPLHILPSAISIVVLIALSSAVRLESDSMLRIPSNFKPLVISILLIISATLTITTIEKIQTKVLWRRAFINTQEMDFMAATRIYEKLYPKLQNDGKFLLMYGSALSFVGKDSLALFVLRESTKRYTDPIASVNLGKSYERLGFPSEAAESYRYASLIVPSAFYPAYLRARLLARQGKKDEAMKLANTLVLKKAKSPSKAIVEMKSELQKLVKLLKE